MRRYVQGVGLILLCVAFWYAAGLSLKSDLRVASASSSDEVSCRASYWIGTRDGFDDGYRAGFEAGYEAGRRYRSGGESGGNEGDSEGGA